MSCKQKTIQRECPFSGIGVHTGAYSSLVLKPAPVNTGIVIQNECFPEEIIKIGSVVPESALHATVIKQGHWAISTIEHVMSAISALGIDNLIIQMSARGPMVEVPIFDGSALPFILGIRDSGIVEQEASRVFITPRVKLVFDDQEGRVIEILPAKKQVKKDGSYERDLFVNYTAQFEHPLVGCQTLQGHVTQDFFVNEIAPARTFGFLQQLPILRKHGLAQGSSLGNTVVLGSEGLMNDLRFPDEFIRHKFLDLVGDLSLLGKPLIGTVNACKTGHSFNKRVVESFLTDPHKWELVS